MISAESQVRVEAGWTQSSCWLPKCAFVPWHFSPCCPPGCGYFLMTNVPSSLYFSPLWVRAHPFDMAASIITQHGTFLSQPSGAFWIDFSSGLPHVGTGVWNWLCLYKMRTSPGHSSWNVCYTGCHCSVFVVVKSPLCGAHARAAGMIGSLWVRGHVPVCCAWWSRPGMSRNSDVHNWGTGWVLLPGSVTGSSLEGTGGHRWTTQEEVLLLFAKE